MTYKAFAAAMLAATLLLALSACGKTQSPAASDKTDSAAQQTEQQTVPETPEAEDAPPNEGESSEEEPWKAALAEDLVGKYA